MMTSRTWGTREVLWAMLHLPFALRHVSQAAGFLSCTFAACIARRRVGDCFVMCCSCEMESEVVVTDFFDGKRKNLIVCERVLL